MWPQIRGSDCQIEQQQESRKFEKQCKQQFLILLLPRHCPGKCDKNEKQTKNALKALVQKRGGGGGNKNRDDCDWNEYTDQCNAIISSSLLALLCLPHSCDCDCAWVLVPGSPTMTGRVSLGKEGGGEGRKSVIIPHAHLSPPSVACAPFPAQREYQGTVNARNNKRRKGAATAASPKSSNKQAAHQIKVIHLQHQHQSPYGG